MEVRTLGTTPLPTLVDVLVRAFDGYFVQLPSDVGYWAHRFHCAAVDLDRSYGVFDGNAMVAFIIQGFRTVEGTRTAFNTGTGVLPNYRALGLVDRLYACALPRMKQAGIGRCTLEVVQQNERAIRVYERIGFHREHPWHSFRGELRGADHARPLVPSTLEAIDPRWRVDDGRYSWDHRWSALQRSDGRWTTHSAPGLGHVVLDQANGRIAQLEVVDEDDPAAWRDLLNAVAGLVKNVSIINVHPGRKALMASLLEAGLVDHVDQYEMRMQVA